jgi:glyoxylase-like metal-dependent hydrolase (beta-lactamase superfamily II)
MMRFVLLFIAASVAFAAPKRIDFTMNGPAPGKFPDKWISGSKSAMDNHDPPIQVHWYNPHTVIMRENKAYNYEAAFMYLYFGNDRAILLDQGSTALPEYWNLRKVVDGVIATWCERNGKNYADYELTVAFSHNHGDHWAAINQFVDRPKTRTMGISLDQMVEFWGMKHYPEEQIEYDLGGRKILIWGSPGHVEEEFAYYDTYTQILFTGDMFYRGRCYITYWDKWFASMQRLMAFLDTHPVRWVVGCHVEISKTGQDYTYGMTWQPDEAPVNMEVSALRHAFDVAKTVKEPGIYFTGEVYLCNQTRMAKTIDKNPYAY